MVYWVFESAKRNKITQIVLWNLQNYSNSSNNQVSVFYLKDLLRAPVLPAAFAVFPRQCLRPPPASICGPGAGTSSSEYWTTAETRDWLNTQLFKQSLSYLTVMRIRNTTLFKPDAKRRNNLIIKPYSVVVVIVVVIIVVAFVVVLFSSLEATEVFCRM